MRRAALTALLLAAWPARGAPPEPAPAPPLPAEAEAEPGPAEEPSPEEHQPSPGSLHAPVEVPRPPPPAGRRPDSRSFVLPVLSYLPETGLAAGASAGIHRRLEGAVRPTSFFGTAVYTTERQGLIDLAADCTFRGGVTLAARARALHYPDRYFGIGPSTPSSAMEHYTRRSLELVAQGEVPFPGLQHLRVGPRVDLRAEEIVDKDPGGTLAAGRVAGADGSRAAAAGAAITWDTRDGPFWPSRGTLAEAWYVYAPDGLARNGAYGRGVLELRHFVPLPAGRVLGLHAYAERAHGAVPFTLLPHIGSTRYLRGIREGRYRDDLSWAVQGELRTPLYRRISAVAFAAAGDVAREVADLRPARAKLAGGAGLRYRLTDEGANIRLDVAGSRFGLQLYVLVLEAF
jgi:hypothetical protein